MFSQLYWTIERFGAKETGISTARQKLQPGVGLHGREERRARHDVRDPLLLLAVVIG